MNAAGAGRLAAGDTMQSILVDAFVSVAALGHASVLASGRCCAEVAVYCLFREHLTAGSISGAIARARGVHELRNVGCRTRA